MGIFKILYLIAGRVAAVWALWEIVDESVRRVPKRPVKRRPKKKR